MNNDKLTRKSFLKKIGLGALTISTGSILLPKNVMGGYETTSMMENLPSRLIRILKILVH